MKEPKSVLVIATQELGDVLLVTPLLRTLRYSWNKAKIDVLVYSGTGGMLENNLDVDNIISVPRNPHTKDFISVAIKIFRKYDLALITQSGDRPYIYGFISSSRRVGMITDLKIKNFWKILMCRKITVLNNDNHTSFQNNLLAKKLGLTPINVIMAPSEPLPETIENSLSYPFCVMHVNARCNYKEWPLSSWEELIRITNEMGYMVYLTGKGERENHVCNELVKKFNSGVISMVDKLSLGEVASLLLRSKFYVGPDTSITHIAASIGIKTIAIFGPSNPKKWGPWPAMINGSNFTTPYKSIYFPWQKVGNVIVMQSSFSCVPCQKEGCERKATSVSDCLYQIRPSMVVSAIKEILKNPRTYLTNNGSSTD